MKRTARDFGIQVEIATVFEVGAEQIFLGQ